MNLNFASFRSCFPLSFAWKWFEIKLLELTVDFFISLRYEWKNNVHILVWQAAPLEVKIPKTGPFPDFDAIFYVILIFG